MATELRWYDTRPGMLDSWMRLFHEQVVPLRTREGFSIDGAWAERERDRFWWVVSRDGSEEEFRAAEEAYYASDDHASVHEEAEGYLAGGSGVFVEPVR